MDQKEKSRGEEISFFFNFIISNIKTKNIIYLNICIQNYN